MAIQGVYTFAQNRKALAKGYKEDRIAHPNQERAHFASVFSAKAGPQESQALEVERKPAERMTFPWLRTTV